MLRQRTSDICPLEGNIHWVHLEYVASSSKCMQYLARGNPAIVCDNIPCCGDNDVNNS